MNPHLFFSRSSVGRLLALALAVLPACQLPAVWTGGEVPFVPTPVEVVDRMLDMAEIRPGDVLYDIGSGEGAIVVRAAKRFGVKAVGIEIDGDLVTRARRRAEKEGVAHLVEFREQDALTANISGATVVMLYMLPEFNAKLRPIFRRDLKPGARIVSHDFPIEGWPPIKTETMRGDFLHDHTIFLWKLE
jgi:SAM-dependent methyltransferase